MQIIFWTVSKNKCTWTNTLSENNRKRRIFSNVSPQRLRAPLTHQGIRSSSKTRAGGQSNRRPSLWRWYPRGLHPWLKVTQKWTTNPVPTPSKPCQGRSRKAEMKKGTHLWDVILLTIHSHLATWLVQGTWGCEFSDSPRPINNIPRHLEKAETNLLQRNECSS